MTNRPGSIKSNNRIQYDTLADGRNVFREYWIHEWDDKNYDFHEHIQDLNQALKRAKELGYGKDAQKLEELS
jgi:hypothetical protein